VPAAKPRPDDATGLQAEALPGPSLSTIREARERVAAVVSTTPMEDSRFLSETLGHPVSLKAENLQRTGSYKIRGAYNLLAQLSEADKARGVVAASAGNHAQGVALAARELGISATIFMPLGVALPKLQATRGYGADVVLHGAIVDETLRAAAEFAERTGAVLIPPFDHPEIVAGQGTLALEILDQVPDVANVIVPIGGGGLISGIAIALKEQRPSVKIFGVEAAAAPSALASRKAGQIVKLESADTLADGIAVKRVGERTFPLIERYVDDIVSVGEDEIASAVHLLLEHEKVLAEGAGAVPLAALIAGKLPVRADDLTVMVLSGGNIDVNMVERIIARGLVADGRLAMLAVTVPDRPGSLARVTALVAAAGANVLQLSHARAFADIAVRDVEIVMQLETRGAEHVRDVVRALEEHGFGVRHE